MSRVIDECCMLFTLPCHSYANTYTYIQMHIHTCSFMSSFIRSGEWSECMNEWMVHRNDACHSLMHLIYTHTHIYTYKYPYIHVYSCHHLFVLVNGLNAWLNERFIGMMPVIHSFMSLIRTHICIHTDIHTHTFIHVIIYSFWWMVWMHEWKIHRNE